MGDGWQGAWRGVTFVAGLAPAEQDKSRSDFQDPGSIMKPLTEPTW